MVRFRLDPNNPPEMTPEQIERLRSMRDEDIDLSDIPERTTGWRRVSELVPADNKAQITLRLDADVLAFFRSTGRRYQSRINAALREYMLAHKPAR
jgi:uncharacterized protein (DUF4415 family)